MYLFLSQCKGAGPCQNVTQQRPAIEFRMFYGKCRNGRREGSSPIPGLLLLVETEVSGGGGHVSGQLQWTTLSQTRGVPYWEGGYLLELGYPDRQWYLGMMVRVWKRDSPAGSGRQDRDIPGHMWGSRLERKGWE